MQNNDMDGVVCRHFKIGGSRNVLWLILCLETNLNMSCVGMGAKKVIYVYYIPTFNT